MPPKDPETTGANSKKRKEAPHSSTNGVKQNEKGRAPKRVKVQNARTILTQTSDAALSNGELNLQAFLKAREFEIKALEDGMRRSKGGLNARAFQQVPRDLRRRTASHNVKRVPKRLQKRAEREMRDDNTPTVKANKRKPIGSRGRLRVETAKRLGILAQKKKLVKGRATKLEGIDTNATAEGIQGRSPRLKVKKPHLSVPPIPPSKFRKRQIHKSWLPTHIYHAKRAKMTEPKKPLWRMAIPLTPTEKSYRPSHRAANAKGALCWDMSYMATIGLKGFETGLEKVLRAIGINTEETWGNAGKKWIQGKRIWNGWLSRDESGHRDYIGPATVIWCHQASHSADEAAKEVNENTAKSKKPALRRLFIRVHPAAFLDIWNELLRLSKMQRPVVHVEDLRFELGSIEVTGPGSTEALLGTLHPFGESTGAKNDGHIKTFNALLGVTNAASLPPNALLTLSIMDPRLRYPPRKVTFPKPSDDQTAFSLLKMLAAWPADQSPASPSLFDRVDRSKAARLASQKSINRRKGLAAPGKYPSLSPLDQPIPVLLFVSRTASPSGQGTWTVIAPWKCVLPIWYCLMHYPLSSGGNPRFGGLQEFRQMSFEHGRPWFPSDYPSTFGGWSWEIDERQKRKEEWERRPKGKRIEFDSLDLGAGRKGEIGLGWACDFEWLWSSVIADEQPDGTPAFEKVSPNNQTKPEPPSPPFQYLPSDIFNSMISNPKLEILSTYLVTVHITLYSRGVPLACARIYQLPQNPISEDEHQESAPPKSNNQQAHSSTAVTAHPTTPSLRDQWLALAPASTSSSSKPKIPKSTAKSRDNQSHIPPIHTHPPGPLRQRALAQSLLQNPPLPYPALSSNSSSNSNNLQSRLSSKSQHRPQQQQQQHPLVPGEEDLIGFVTSGNFNLAQGKGTAIGSVSVQRLLLRRRREGNREEKAAPTAGRDGVPRSGWGSGLTREDRMCIVRNAGESVGRLGIWEIV